MSARVACLSACAALGCSGDPVQPSSSCSPTAVTTFVDGALSIGLGDPATFSSLASGQSVTLVRGSQGGYMITPLVRADLEQLGTDGQCIELSTSVDVSSLSEPAVTVIELKHPALYGTLAFTSILPLFLSFDPTELDGKEALVSARWHDDDREASGSVSIVLAYAP